ncbi:FAD binding domain protein [Penicillium verhagenii]|nr:FAD binding domain protein [Penicillium verhagenii]
MAFVFSSLAIATLLIVVVWFKRRTNSLTQRRSQPQNPPKPNPVVDKFTVELPNITLLRYDTDAFHRSIESYWAQQEREVVQAAIIQPRNASELARVVTFLKNEYDMRCLQKEPRLDQALFAIRGGGQSPASGSASAKGGALIDLSLFREVTIADNRESVAVGAGCQWIDVSRVLDEKGLAVVGGRSSGVGVAGFTLGGKYTPSLRQSLTLIFLAGGLSFFTPQFGLGCSNVLAYEVVLASGEIATATASSHSIFGGL